MDNVLETQGVGLTVFGGAVTEMAPEDLPEGASPWNQDCDYTPGAVFTRGGRANQITFFNQFVNATPGLGQSLPGAFAPNEVPWTAPNNITLDTPGTPSTVALASVLPTNPLLGSDASTPNTPGSGSWIVTIGPGVVVPVYAWWQGNEAGAITVTSPGWTTGPIIGGGLDYGRFAPATGLSFTFNTAAPAQYNGILTCWVSDGHNPVRLQNWGAPFTGMTQVTSTTPAQGVSAGTVLYCSVALNNLTTASSITAPFDPTKSTVTDTDGNAWTFIQQSQAVAVANGMCGIALWICFFPNKGTKPVVTVTLNDSTGAIMTAGNMSTNLGEVAHLVADGIYQPVDQSANGSGSGNSSSLTINTSPTIPISTSFLATTHASIQTQPTSTPAGGAWGIWFGLDPYSVSGESQLFMNATATGAVSATTTWGGAASQFASVLFNLPNVGRIAPFPLQNANNSNSTFPPTPATITMPSATTAGNLILIVTNVITGITGPLTVSYTDTQNNTYNVLSAGGSTGGVFIAVGIAESIAGGANTITIHGTGTGSTHFSIAYELAAFPQPGISPNVSQILAGSHYGLNIPSTSSVLGLQVIVQGNQTTTDPSAIVSVSLNQPGAQSFTAQLPTSNGTVTLGTSLSQWNLQLTPAMLNAATFAVDVVASTGVTVPETVSVYNVGIRVFYTPSPPANFNWVKTYEQTDGEVDTLALDSVGILWDEDVDSNPTVFTSIFSNILPNTFAKSVTFNDIEYIAFSNLLNGTDIPRQWNGTFLDRVSMVGPGAMINATAQASNANIVSITQNPATQIRRIVWGASSNAINDSTPGNLLLIFGEGRTGSNTYQSLPPYNASFGQGTTVVLSNITNPFPLKGGGSLPFNLNNGPNANGSYTVLQVTTGVVGGAEICPLFTVQAPATEYGYSNDFGSGGTPTSGWFYQSALATMTTAAPVPNLQIGNQFTLTGTGGAPPAGYDGTYTVLQTPNAGQYSVSSISLTGNIATYSFTTITGSAPTVGQLVTVTGALNSVGTPGIFNVQQVAITAVSGTSAGGTFSVNLSSSDIIAQPQTGCSAVVAGTIFVFDAGAIVGNKTGGALVTQGVIGTGVRKVCVSFLTRSGYITQPSPIYTFNVTSGSSSIVVTGLPIGPSNVVARIVEFTGANGGNFFYIPQPVIVNVGGTNIVNSSTVVNDNTSTTATFSFSDAVLLAATGIDIPGNNLFNTIELGSCRGFVTYSQRVIAWSEQSKITNLRNLSFDGGIGGGTGGQTTFPLGWTVDATNGGGVSLINSPVFGFAVQIQNTSGSTQTTYGMLTQPAFQDEFLVPIVASGALYSVRITAWSPTGAASGNLVVDLFSPSFNTVYGSFTVPLHSLGTTQQIFTGTLLTQAFAKVPPDLVIRQYTTGIPNNTTVLIDRMEPFLTLTPTYTTQMKSSYALNQEAFDLSTGVLGPAQNGQPINGAMVLFDLLYALKERSWFSTSDNGVTEPFEWSWKEVSLKVGTVGIHSYDHGEGWALSGNREGVFFFEGGEPIKVSQEIQPLWDLINWNFGHTIWVRNDPEQRRFTVGVPIPTPNPYMPEFPTNANPTSPNVVLMCNYRELNTGAAMASTGPIRSTYSGRIMSPEPARKWSFWNIVCPYSDYIDRANNQWPQWFCTGYNDYKMFALQASQLSDDGNAINSFYITYGFVKPETADAKGLGLFRMELPYLTILAVGSGTLNTFVYPESPTNPAYDLDILPLPATTQGDLELGVNVKGQRFFIRFGTNAVGAGFRVSKLVVPLITDTWSPVKGWNAVIA